MWNYQLPGPAGPHVEGGHLKPAKQEATSLPVEQIVGFLLWLYVRIFKDVLRFYSRSTLKLRLFTVYSALQVMDLNVDSRLHYGPEGVGCHTVFQPHFSSPLSLPPPLPGGGLSCLYCLASPTPLTLESKEKEGALSRSWFQQHRPSVCGDSPPHTPHLSP